MSSYVLNLWAAPYFAAFLILVILGGFLFYKKHRNPHVKLYVVSLLFTSFHCFSAGMATCSEHIEIWKMWTLINAIALLLSVTTLFHFSQLFRIKGRFLQEKGLFLIYGILVLFFIMVLLNPNGLMFSQIVRTDDSAMGLYGRAQGSAPPPFFAFFYLTICLLLACAIVNFFRMLRQERLHRRASYFILGTLFPLIGHMVVFILLGIFLLNPPVQFGIVLWSLTGLTIGYGIIKGKLFDIDVIVKKSVLVTMITFVLAVAFFIIEESLERFVSSQIFSGIQLSWMISAGVVIIAFFPVKIGCQKLTNRLWPDVKKQEDNLRIYREQLEHALSDGRITEKEEAMLENLRSSLGISEKVNKQLIKDMKKDRGT